MLLKKTLTMTTGLALLLSSTTLTFAQTMDELVAAAKAEGMLTTIALPHDW